MSWTDVIAIIGAGAWFPQIYSFFRERYTKPKISVFEAGNIELAYGTAGPTLGLHGSLLCEGKKAFVKSISLLIEKRRNRSHHFFEWNTFRSAQLGGPIELTAGFIITTDRPHRYNILFTDAHPNAKYEIREVLTKVLSEWGSDVHGKSEEILALIREHGIDYGGASTYLYDNDFTKTSKSWSEAFELLERRNYWEAGEYDMSVIMHNCITRFDL